ncbi:pyrrolidone-carboxylate peptidase [Piscinibacter gummiphilus]|nr:pyrrolidone-carboxylate peptidase [Piscinibacter gummiphilus]
MHNSVVTRTRRPPKILLTGFEPFGGDTVNPSLEVVQALDGEHVGGAAVVGLGLPCVYADAVAGLDRALEALSPVLVICLGQAAGAPGLRLERVAVNLSDTVQPDNAGAVLRDTPVVAGGPAAYFSTLPLTRMLEALRAHGHVAELSGSAGAYVCNHVFYTLQHRLVGRALPAGFIHLPLLPRQAAGRAGVPGMALESQVAAVRLAIEAAMPA